MTKSLKDAPAGTLRWWGMQSAEAFDYVSGFLIEQGFEGPTTWSEGAFVPYEKFTSSTIKVKVGMSTFTADAGYAVFDCKALLYSKTLAELQQSADAEKTSAAKTSTFAPCLMIPLSYLKWCTGPADENPSWAMTLGSDTTRPGVQAFVADFSHLMGPLIDALDSDEALEVLLTRYLDRSRPQWVRSTPPNFVGLPELVALLRSRSRLQRRGERGAADAGAPSLEKKSEP